ncbi:baseplate J/gp47 family protein [Methylicorpusculum sp.]|uniref:baseplate J/gp47 family protein n=2 Tax=Methylicorpusculum sp. TaxID=2713644 RepID=UPI00273057D8|nr:baseplate J/gp47 family protein [Methylicorpusculum sp.]MDP2179848.1 baseplate J/gp47 family protein [Methylicorpusculum sp.]MDP3528535.1 baseplate J/gp47 family protein [Methylicorpusculum sp.]
MATDDCKQNRDPLKLIHEGTSQDARLLKALSPDYAPVNEHRPEHGMVFAKDYAAFLNYYGSNTTVSGDWQRFFSKDVSLQLAVASVQAVDNYRAYVKERFDYLNDRDHKNETDKLKNNLGLLFSCAGSLASQLDRLKEGLPADNALKSTLVNRIQTQLAPAFKRLISYSKADLAQALPHPLVADIPADLSVLGVNAVKFSEVLAAGLSKDWISGANDWAAYLGLINGDPGIFGLPPGDAFERINHLATHNLFTSAFDKFLKVYARTVVDAQAALEASFTGQDSHDPHYTLFLAFLRLFEHARAQINTITGRHLDFYYRDILQLKEKPAEPAQVHLLVELTRQTQAHLLELGSLFKAGKDDWGKDAFFAAASNFVANRTQVSGLKTVYRHDDEKLGFTVPENMHQNRFFASPEAASADGLGAKLREQDPTWHPFFNKEYKNGKLQTINMPEAELGFIVASHYLWLAEGTRTLVLELMLAGSHSGSGPELKDDITCWLSAEKGWLEKTATSFVRNGNKLTLTVILGGADAAVTAYSDKVHGYGFATALPVLLVKLRHREGVSFIYPELEAFIITSIKLTVSVKGLRSLAVSNDFGSVDLSKPFQPYGAQPVNGTRFTIGSKEVFQKRLVSATLTFDWQNPPRYYRTPSFFPLLISMPLAANTINQQPGGSQMVAVEDESAAIAAADNDKPTIAVAYLKDGEWSDPSGSFDFDTGTFNLTAAAQQTTGNFAGMQENSPYPVKAVNGYLRLIFQGDMGFNQYLLDLTHFLADIDPKPPFHPGAPVIGPFAERITMDYTAEQTLSLSGSVAAGNDQQALFFHVGPFGHALQNPKLPAVKPVYLLPQFVVTREESPVPSSAEFYIGLTGLQPPQNLALLFQVADGTADPLTVKPDQHIQWSYLRNNEWKAFESGEVQDDTAGLLKSGIIVFTVPEDADTGNTLLPGAMHWLRAAVSFDSEAVCRLQKVAAQALKAGFVDKDNDPAFSAKVLAAGTITKLDRPHAAVKKIDQPFESFGGRGAEAAEAFYSRISERLRHKDRAVALWDYEHLVLDAFPELYRAKCLNHTHYEPGESGDGTYRELAPGHVTVVTLPNQQFHTFKDPLRPFTSLGLLTSVEKFLRQRLPCFVKLHVRNPQFEAVRCAFKVRFYEGFDEMFYKKTLQEAIIRFLSPWAFFSDAMPSFGGKVHKSVLINFVEEQAYVDYVTDFLMFHDIGDVKSNVNTDVAEGSTAVSILVSAAEHSIDALNPAGLQSSGETCPCES